MNYSSLIAIGSIVLTAASFAAAMNINSNTTLNQDLNEPLIITADGVTVDLNGHSINCTGDAIQISGRSNVTILSTYEMAEVGASSTSTGIRVVNSRDVSISHIWVHDRNNGVSVENSQRVYISDVNSANNTRDGFRIRSSNTVTFYNCESICNYGGFDQNFGQFVTYSNSFAGDNLTNGFEVDTASAFYYDTCVSMLNGLIDDPTDNRGKHGFSITGDCYYGYVTGCQSIMNKGDGIHMKDASYMTLTGSNAYYNEGQGFSIADTSCNNWSVECNSSDNGSHGLKLDSTSVKNYFSLCNFNNNGKDGIQIRNNSRNNAFYNCEAVLNKDEDLDDDGLPNYYSECNFPVIN